MAGEAETGPVRPEFRANIDLLAPHDIAGGWFIAGWFTHTGEDEDLPDYATLWFDEGAIAGALTAVFFQRNDLPEGGLGFLFFVAAEQSERGRFRRMIITCGGVDRNLYAGDLAGATPARNDLEPRLRFILTLSGDREKNARFEALLAAKIPVWQPGYVELYGRAAKANGWFVSGWLASPWEEQAAPEQVTFSFEQAEISGPPQTVTFPRGDLKDAARGFVLFLAGGEQPAGALQAVTFLHEGEAMRVPVMPAAPVLAEPALMSRIRTSLGLARPGRARQKLRKLLPQAPYTGEDTMAALAPAVHFVVEEAIVCGPEGVVLIGWMMAQPGAVAGIWLHGGALSVPVPMQDAIRTNRFDVQESHAKFGFDEAASGFVVFVPGAFDPAGPLYVEIETDQAVTGYRNLPAPTRRGLPAIKHLLSAASPRFAEIQAAYDKVLGPAVAALNRGRLAARRGVTLADFGPVPASPLYSVIVPLYGRLDFLEYQLALFSAHPGSAAVEFIYVLDEPARRQEAYALFTAAWERYQVPFRAVFMDQNMGYAPANNAGLQQASGTYVAFLNSDIFPGTPDWLERLSARLAADAGIGVIGPLLLYEDGSVQHRGMYFKRLPEFGNWHFPMHFDKGLRFSGGDELTAYLSITGACMVMKRELAVSLGGFDEGFVIGDFEDADLCLKIQELGMLCVVDPAVSLFHLERKSQALNPGGWRMNLTAYNAWLHEGRWSGLISAEQSQGVAAG